MIYKRRMKEIFFAKPTFEFSGLVARLPLTLAGTPHASLISSFSNEDLGMRRSSYFPGVKKILSTEQKEEIGP